MKVAVNPANEVDIEKELTEEQMQNWRNIFPHLFGVSGEFVPDEQIQKLRNEFQQMANRLPNEVGGNENESKSNN